MTADDPTPQRSRLNPQRWPIRVLTTVTAAIIVMIAVAMIGAAALWGLRWSLTTSENSVITNRAADIANALVTSGPAAAVTLAAQPASHLDLVQLHRVDGQVLVRRPQAERSLDEVPLAPDGEQLITPGVTGAMGTEYRVMSQVILDPRTRIPYVLYIGTETSRNDPFFDFVNGLVLLSIPVSGLTSGVVTWFTMRRALHPVERMRRRVAEISTSDLEQRVPVPGTHDEIERLAVTMNEMLARLENGRKQQIAFVGDASHELRSPLSTLSTMLELSSTSGQPVDVDTVDSLLLPEVERMRGLVEDLLLLAKSDEQGIPLRREDVDLDDIVLAEASRLRSVGELEVDVSITPARITGDADSLVRVLRNLADNARRHAESRVGLTLSVGPASSDGGDPARTVAVLAVDDDGPGVPPEQRPYVFDRFARLQHDRGRDSGGSGLGLAIVAEIVRTHGGSVSVGDSPLGGARFSAELPCQEIPELSYDDEG